jgi:predicted transcriptional regulator
MDEKLLKSLDLNESETSVYQTILGNPGITPTDLARAAKLKRTTAYSVARSLVEKGLVIEDGTRRPRIFSASSPDEVLALIEGEKKKLAAREASLKQVAAELSNLTAKSTYPVPTVRFVEEGKIDAYLRQQSPVWDKSLLEVDPTWWGFLDHTLLDYHADWLDWYWDRSDVDERIQVKLLSNRAPVELDVKTRLEKKIGQRRQTKYWGEATSFISSTWITGDYVIMVNTQVRPFYLIEIHSRPLAHDQREVFRNLWELV